MSFFKKITSPSYLWGIWSVAMGIPNRNIDITAVVVVRTILFLPLWFYVISQTVYPIVYPRVERATIEVLTRASDELLPLASDVVIETIFNNNNKNDNSNKYKNNDNEGTE